MRSAGVVISGRTHQSVQKYYDFEYNLRGSLPIETLPPYGISVADPEISDDELESLDQVERYWFKSNEEWLVVQPYHLAANGSVSVTPILTTAKYQYSMEGYDIHPIPGVAILENKTSDMGDGSTRIVHIHTIVDQEQYLKLYKSPIMIWPRMGAESAFLLITEVAGNGEVTVVESNRIAPALNTSNQPVYQQTINNHVILRGGGL